MIGNEFPSNLPHLHNCPHKIWYEALESRDQGNENGDWSFSGMERLPKARKPNPTPWVPELNKKKCSSHWWLPFQRNEGPNMLTRPKPQGGVLPPWGPCKRHHQEKIKPGMAHWLSASIGFSGRQQWNLIKGFRESSRSSGPWDNWSRDLEYQFCSLCPPICREWRERNRKIMKNNTWLRDWCDQQNFGGFDHRPVYTTPRLLSTNRKKGS